jgi:ABC-type glycerol-3-phosphate transport system permease component
MTTQRSSFSTSRLTSFLASYGSLVLVGLLISIPLAWFLITSFKPQEEYMSYPVHFFPKRLYLETYQAALTMIDYFRFAGHSLILSLTHTTLTVTASAMAGFAFARFNVPGRNKLFVIVIAMLIVPAIIMQIPQFIIFSKIGLTGTWWPWVLWGLAASPFFIFLFRQFFAAFPKELEDAAEIDGCGPFRTFVSIFLPNSKPVLATAFILNFTGQWGDYINPYLFLKASNQTLAVKLQTGYLSPQGQTLTTIILAAAVLYVLPVVIIFFMGQKYILEGVVTSGLSGR